MSRPTNDPKNYRIDLRINEETNNRLQEICQQKGITLAEYVRGLINQQTGTIPDTNDHRDRILHLIDALSEAKICAGAEFEALCNEQKFEESVIFSMLRDTLQAQRVVLSDYIVSVKEFI